MQAKKEGDIYWITLPGDTGSLIDIWDQLEADYPTGHWVLIWEPRDISEDDLDFLDDKTEEYSGGQRALVLMSQHLDYDRVPDTINLAPTRQEALDIIDMEKMQWDLGA